MALLELIKEGLVDALREGLEEMVTTPGGHPSPSVAMMHFDRYHVYPRGVGYRDRACFIGQSLRLSVDQIDEMLKILFRDSFT